MQDVIVCLAVKSVRWKIEKRVIGRIGHVVRMEFDRLMVLGWYEWLECRNKKMRTKRKTVLCWKRMLSEGGVYWTDVEKVCSDRDG